MSEESSSIWFSFSETLAEALILSIIILRFPMYSTDRIVRTVFSVIYCPVMLSFIYMIRVLEGREFLIWIVLISSWGCDTLAYCSGVLLGKHHPFAKLSPKK